MGSKNYTDIVIIGAGLSGIGAACHLSRKNPEKTYTILESREALGGTWSLFTYPGIRSDSDMYTFGYSFKTWDSPKSFADAPSILKYLNEAADEYNVRHSIKYAQRGVSYSFNQTENLWTIVAVNPKTKKETIYTCQFILSCTGYYNYNKGYTPKYKGIEDFKGTLIHPQKWPKAIDLSNKKVVVIGSGATAVTIIPKIAPITAKVTMLQRSPTYIGALPNKDKIADIIKFMFPRKWAYKLIRVKNVMLDMLFFNLCRRFPETMKKFIVKNAKKELGTFPVDPHFTPNYKPWTQRFCLTPDGDFFKVIKKGLADVVTEHINGFTEKGIVLKSGKILEADVIISATGLNILPFGGVKIAVDAKPFHIAESFVYKGLMLSNLPNFFVFVGYTNASWTLKSDLTSAYVSRVFNYMNKHHFKSVMVKQLDPNLKPRPLLNLDSGYIHRAENTLPKQSNKIPWRVYQNYILDYKMLKIDKIKDKHLFFS